MRLAIRFQCNGALRVSRCPAALLLFSTKNRQDERNSQLSETNSSLNPRTQYGDDVNRVNRDYGDFACRNLAPTQTQLKSCTLRMLRVSVYGEFWLSIMHRAQ
ncbi:uncharacterized protein UMAG_01360 [Mycosarcoma maydis]|uniref:Uncharacterized protein n=1 Tax=Mycosarcoma maydis TaxID=5270 RepID=A0A0D1E7I5_MYCMD|nr:uncharacterized protein UMAG_01360 [Ustilago maydis 521]KIS71466.1 hypothetical protein UMAG_01360 [Ustilago maydis 521]|eukprot:XP_011387252.1 hypothetical protein UMAG_01360 [Ustilago maydis 521]